MPLSDLDAKLAALDDAFKEAKVDSFEKKLPEPGDYATTFVGVDFFEMKNPPFTAFLKFQLEVIVDPVYAGWEIEVVHNLEDPDRLVWLKKDLTRLGVDVNAEDFSLMQVRPGSPLWDTIIGKTVDISIKEGKKNEKTGKPYINVWINGISEPIGSDIGPQSLVGSAIKGPLDAEGVEVPANSDGDIPF